jgi:hypothetical protein
MTREAECVFQASSKNDLIFKCSTKFVKGESMMMMMIVFFVEVVGIDKSILFLYLFMIHLNKK